MNQPRYHPRKIPGIAWAFMLCGPLLLVNPTLAAPPPVITLHPTNQTVALGGTALFAVEATSGTILSYQWYFQAATIAGATSNVYTIASVQLTNAGTYYAAVMNAGGTVYSSNAVLTVKNAPILSGANDLAAINEDAITNGGTMVSSLIAGRVTDPDPGALQGIAVTAVNDGNGTWQYSTNGGVLWSGFGTPSATSARLLASNANTYVRFVPNTNWNGFVSNGLTFRAWDQTTGAAGATADVTTNGGTTAFSTNTASSSLTVSPLNDTPLASSQNVSTDEDTPKLITLTGGDLENDPLTFSIVSGPTNGVLNGLNATNGTVTYTPNTNFNGGDSFTFQVNDGTTNSPSAMVTITVAPVNDAPVADGQSVSTAEDTAKPITLTGSDVENSPLTFSLVTGPTNGVLSGLNANNVTVTYTPSTNFNGGDSFKFQVNDGTTNSVTATIGITVTPVNDAPVANGQSVSTAEDTAKAITLTGSDVDNDLLTFSIVNGPTNGVLSGLNPTNGTVTYTPNTNFNGADSFTFQVNDGSSNSTPATVGITVTPVNDTPMANDQSVSTAEDTAKLITLTGSDVENSPLTFSLVTGPTNGVLSGLNATNGTVTYTPNTNFNGADSFTFQVNDGTINSAIATVGITVIPVNDAPVLSVASDLTAINEDDVTNVGTLVTNLIAGLVTDPDLGALQGIAVTAVNNGNGTWQYSTNGGLNWVAFGTPSGLAARLLQADTSTYVRFVPNTDWNGTVTNGLTFRAWDQTTGTAGGTAVARSGGTMLDEFSTVAYTNNNGTDSWNGNWVDIDGSASGGSIIVVSSSGTLEVTANNSSDWIYRAANLSGVASAIVSFDYDSKLNDGSGGRIDLQVSSNAGTNYTTIATFSATTNFGIGTFSADISAYATSNTRIRLLTSGKSTPTKRVEFDNMQIGFTANTGGATAFSSNTASSSIVVISVNDAPAANGQSFSTAEDTAKAITLTGSDVENSPLTFSIVSATTNGVLSGFNPTNGTVTYTPNTNFNGGDSFAFQVNDGTTNSPTATVGITVTPVNDRPVANGQSVSTAEDTAKAITLTGSDVENSPLTFSVVSAPTNGVLSGLNPTTGTVTYTPSTNFNGGDSFTFRVNDGTTNSASATVGITVTPVNDAPVANGQTVGTLEATAIAITLTGSDTESNALTYALVALPAQGNISGFNTNNGTLTYTPSNGYAGLDSFAFSVHDGLTNSGPATVNITITPAADVITILSGPKTVAPLTNFTYTFAVSNQGPSAASNVVAAGQLSSNVTFISASQGGTYLAGVVTWPPVASLASGAVTNFTVTVKSPTRGTVTSTASSTSTTSDPNPSNNNGSAPAAGVTTAITPVKIDNTSSGASVNTLNWSHTISPGSARILIVGVSIDSAAANVVAATFANFLPLTPIGQTNGSQTKVAMYYLLNPPVGTFPISVNLSASVGIVGGAVSFSGVDQSSPITAFSGNAGISNLATVTVGSLLGGVVIDTVAPKSPAQAQVAGAEHAVAWNRYSASYSGAGGSLPGETFAVPTWTFASPTSWAMGAVALNPAAALADIALIATGPASVGAASNLTYAIIVTNLGPDPATNLVVSDALPAGATFVSASGGGSVSNGVVTWPSLTNFVSGTTTNYTVTITAPGTGPLTNVAYSTASTADPDAANNNGTGTGNQIITLVATRADVAATVSGPVSVFAAANISYTILVTNTGPSPASNVVVSDSLPMGATFVSASGGGTHNAGVVTWPALDSLDNGTATNFAVTISAPASGTLTNIVSSAAATTDPELSNNDGTSAGSKVVTMVYPPASITGQLTGAGDAFQVDFNTLPNTVVAIEASTNLLQWETLLTTNSVTGSGGIMDYDFTNHPMRFYRTAQTP